MTKNSSSSCGRINKAKPYREDEWGTLTYDVDDIIAERKEWEAEVEKQKARADEAEDMIKHWKGAYELYYDEWLKEKKRAEKAEAKLKHAADELVRIYTMLYEEGFGRHNEIMELAKELSEDE